MTMTAQQSVTMSVKLQMTMRGESRRQLADVLGVTYSALGHRLTGHSPWSLEDLDKLCEHYALTLSQLVNPPVDALAGSVSRREPTSQGSVLVLPRPRRADLHVLACAA